MKKIIILSLTTTSLLLAAGYKVPEQSLNSMALGGAYVAHTPGADAAYFNPANMAFLPDNQMFEAGATFIHLPSNTFQGYQALSATEVYPANGESEVENIVIPFLHYVANPMGDLRWGASLAVPSGVTKHWESPYQKLFAEEFTLKVIELNPVLSYKVTDNFAIGGGARFIYSEGVVKSDGTAAGVPIKRELEGDTIQYGYNLAMTYKPTGDINLAATYRSNIDLKEEGKANLYLGGIGQQYDADVTVPVPATLSLAVSKTWVDHFTLELEYERTYWSTYDELDFNYGSAIQPALIASYDDPESRDWEDTNTFRVGASVDVAEDTTFMLGFAKDEGPVKKSRLGYELPDSDGEIFSMGIRIQANENLAWGVAYLHDEKEGISIDPGENQDGIIGSFSAGGANLLTAGMTYKF